MCVAKLGIVGFFLGPVVIVGVIVLLGYLVRQGQFGTEAEDMVLAIPYFGAFYERIFKPSTYYKTDTTLMFQAVVNSVVQEVVEQVMSAKGLHPLTELERKPIMREFYQR